MRRYRRRGRWWRWGAVLLLIAVAGLSIYQVGRSALALRGTFSTGPPPGR